MDKLPNTSPKLVEISIVHAEVLATAHGVCFEMPWSIKDFQELLVLPTSFGFLAQIEQEKMASLQNVQESQSDQITPDIFGFGLCSAVQEQCEILTIGVLPKWRRQKIGDRLLQQVVEQAKTLGAGEIFLEVAENNMPAHALYNSHGFKEVGRRPNYYREGGGRVDAIRLSKTIS
jgi:[ribosomal protein S18]-alanine N-acetyltransferase